ncbi:hypothetical protein BDM02DRAFT_3087468 [Thelephora ganbajun]|uniref:Uncharacterized protein n=1 Tax=Thelephora ganbajun TaxID=370292 RepID=A0ACB6ZUT3_THEGA|nr:hypothetical protein BDM02DRAFT_3087468 [Thelephora ganbajun]
MKDAFEPPQGAVLMGDPDDEVGTIEIGEFDWNSVKDDEEIELWLVRVPNSIKPKHLNDAVFDAPSSSSTHTLGQVKRKHETYDLWSLGDRDDNDVDHDQIGGDEMKGFSCLLPRKSKGGKLYIGPKPITRRLILAASPPTPGTQNPAMLHQNPPRHSYPAERFKHRYTPYGSSTLASVPPITTDPASAMDVDQEGNTSISPTTRKPKKRSKLTGDPKKITKRTKTGKS